MGSAHNSSTLKHLVSPCSLCPTVRIISWFSKASIAHAPHPQRVDLFSPGDRRGVQVLLPMPCGCASLSQVWSLDSWPSSLWTSQRTSQRAHTSSVAHTVQPATNFLLLWPDSPYPCPIMSVPTGTHSCLVLQALCLPGFGASWSLCNHRSLPRKKC